MSGIVRSNCGIYKLSNIIDGKFYIGSTYRLKKREGEHKYDLQKDRTNSRIKNAVLKYGSDNFNFEVLEHINFGNWVTKQYIKEFLECREQYYVDLLNPEYNIRKKDISRNTGVCSDKQREHLKRVSHLPKNPELCRLNGIKRRGKHLGEDNKQSIAVDVYKADNLEFIETIIGIRSCERKYNFDGGRICDICKRGVIDLSIYDYVFRYHGDTLDTLIRKRKINKGYKQKNTRPILQVDKEGNIIKEWRTCKDAMNALNLHRGAVNRVVSGKYKQTKGYYFKYKKNE